MSFWRVTGNLACRCLWPANQGRADELDYILIQPNGADLMTEWSRVILRHSGWDGRRQDLSYRYAVAASIQFQ